MALVINHNLMAMNSARNLSDHYGVSATAPMDPLGAQLMEPRRAPIMEPFGDQAMEPFRDHLMEPGQP